MNIKNHMTLAVCLLTGWFVVYNAGARSPVLETSEAKLSYSIGLQVGKTLSAKEIEIDPDSFILGLHDGRFGHKPLLTDQQIREVAAGLQQKIITWEEEKRNRPIERNTRQHDVFFAQNPQRAGSEYAPRVPPGKRHGNPILEISRPPFDAVAWHGETDSVEQAP